ncbi:hypothetical protein GCM10009104_29230 [Marinobacterium maritimum]|uniref:Uncharacterized protein n=1 Tax=Marinobacterium maritimum TaxID=500162 RepID=A0ABP3TFS9_9GAMM
MNSETRDKIVQMDLSLVAPICYLTETFNALLRGCFRILCRYPRACLSLTGLLYLTGLVLINVPGLEFSIATAFLTLTAPIAMPLGFVLAYMGVGAILLALFARNPATRLPFAALLELLLLGPMLITALSDTRLMLLVGDNGSFVILVAHLCLMPWLFLRYQGWFMRHARWSTPAVLVLVSLIGFESQSGFTTTRISPEYFSLSDCRWERPINGVGVKGKAVQSCDVQLHHEGQEYHFRDVVMPSGRVSYLEVRHALVDHFQLR